MKNTIMHEQLTLYEGTSIRARHIDYKHFTFPWHFHSEYEIIYVRESTGQRFVADSIETFGAGDLILLGHNVPHYMKSAPEYEQEDCTLRVKGVVIQFEKDFMQHAISHYTALAPIKTLLEESRRGIHFPAPDNRELLPLLEQLPNIKGVEQLITLLLLLERMTNVKSRRYLGSLHFHNTLSSFTDNRLEKILSYITYHYTENINLDQIATMTAMNTASFCRYFKEKAGKTFMQYILELRVGYACRLLASNQMDISQIGIECGFNTLSHFNRIFKRITGFTPSGYRKEILK